MFVCCPLMQLQLPVVVLRYPQGMKALSLANFLVSNGISTDQARILGNTLAEHPYLKSLCGNKGDGTEELDMRGKDMGEAGIAMLAPPRDRCQRGAAGVGSRIE
jgi:hypothetical protein